MAYMVISFEDLKVKFKIDDIIFIINPNSGKQDSHKIINSLLEINPKAQYFISNTIEKFDHFFSSNIDKYKVVVICGGDGTLNNALKFVAKNNQLVLAMLPNGSGDGFANEMGFKKDIPALIELIKIGETELIDLIKVNDDYSCNMIGIGLDSHIAAAFEGSNKRGLKSYIYLTIKSLLKYKPITATIQVNGTTIHGSYQMINIANTRQYGNNAYIAPNAMYNDGWLELVLVKPIPFYLMPDFIIKLFRGKLKSSKYIHFIKTKELTIKSNSENYHIDGEYRRMPVELNISIGQQFKIIKAK